MIVAHRTTAPTATLALEDARASDLLSALVDDARSLW